MAAALASTVRVPTPDLTNGPPAEGHSTRKRSPQSRSPSPSRAPPSLRRRSRSPEPRRLPRDVDRNRAEERARQFAVRQREGQAKEAKPMTAEEKQASAKAEYNRLLNVKSGGTYVPPARLRALQEEITDKSSKEYQRMAWESLKKSINGLVNKVNISNIKHIVPELFNENLVRGRGLFCRSIMKAEAASISFTPVYAAMVAVVNTKLPQVGELLVNRLVMQFKKAYKRNDKSVCLSATTFLAHLTNQQVVHEMLAAQMLLILLNKPTNDSVEVAVGLMKEVGAHIDAMNTKIAEAVYDQFRKILHDGEIDKRTQYMIEVLYQIRKDGYKNHESLKDELDLVDEEDQITHTPNLEDSLDTQEGTNIFKFDPEWEASEEAYRKLKAEILGEASGSEDEDEDEDDESEDDEEDAQEKALEIKDQSNTDLVNLRKTIYLTMTSSLSYEEACHKLMRVNLPAGREEELPSMIIECSIEGRTYNKFHGLIAERFCNLNRLWRELFQNQFIIRYETIHRQDSNKLRITAQFFGYLLSTDSISWDVFHVIRVTEEDTTSSSRIFIKILIEELAAAMSKKALVTRFKEDELQPALVGFFPTDNAKNTRFSINFFTAIGMGELTEGMREYLKNLPKPAPAAPPPQLRDRSASVSSYSSYSSRSRSRTPSRARGRASSHDSRSSRSYSRSRTPSRRRARERSASYDSRRSSGSRSRGRSASYDSRQRSRRRDRSSSYDSRSRTPSKSRRQARSRSRSYDSPRQSKRSRSYDSRSPAPRARRPPSRDIHSPRRRRSRSSDLRSRSRTPEARTRRRNDSRSASPRRRSYSRSRSPQRDRSRSRAGVDSYRPRYPSKRRDARSPTGSTRRTISPDDRRRRASSTHGAKDRENIRSAKPAADDDAQAHIHPSRRAQVPAQQAGAGRGRARASDLN